jgi:uncharacterized protein DUF6899
MPYITQENRKRFQAVIEALLEDHLTITEGDLNYLITRCVKTYLNSRPISYQHYNAAIGVLECAKLELYRHRIADYEDLKCFENGDV